MLKSSYHPFAGCGIAITFGSWFWLRIESGFQYRRQSLLTFWNPCGIMFPHDLLSIAQQLRHVAHGHAGSLQ